MTRVLTICLLMFGLAASSLAADDEQACLSREQQQAAVAGGRAVPLSTAIRAVRGQVPGRQVVRAQLCREAKGLVYVLTVLARDGKVTHARVEAASGGFMDEL